MAEVTRILQSIEAGDPQAAEKLLPLVYAELRKLAAAKMAHEQPGQTLQATALVHEAYLRLVDDDRAVRWNSRGHFFSAAAEAMRRILVEKARRKKSPRHGGGQRRIELDDALAVPDRQADELLAIDEALARFAEVAPAKAELVKLRFFAGMTIPEAADVLGISHATAERYWAYARVWLYCQLNDGRQPPESSEKPPDS
jgi:RNA polymerase sigma factor (TIGR02999 family)